MAPGVAFTAATSLLEPSAPSGGAALRRWFTNTLVVPEPSLRTTRWIGSAGSVRPGFRVAMGLVPACDSAAQMRASVAASSRNSPLDTPGKFTMVTMPPTRVGNWNRLRRSSSTGGSGTSAAPKSTVASVMALTQADEPAGLHSSGRPVCRL